MITKRKPTHPGIVLLEDYIKPSGQSISTFAKRIGISRKTMSKIVNGRQGISPGFSILLGRITNTTAESWYGMQVNLDLWNAQNEMHDL